MLERSQSQRLARLSAQTASPAAAQVIANSLDQVLRAVTPLNRSVRLQVVQAEVMAETLQGHTIVAHEALANLPEGERQFVLAHELGHVALGHWQQVGELYRLHVPGEVQPQLTDAAAPALGPAASPLAHQQEYEGGAYGLRALTPPRRPPAGRRPRAEQRPTRSGDHCGGDGRGRQERLVS